MKRLSIVVLVLAASLACRKPDPLTHEKAKAMIEASMAFQEPIEDDVRKALKYDGELKREILRVQALTTKPDGPLGMAGETATVTFSWRWTSGPLEASRYVTAAKIHGDSHGWTLYEDKLKQNLRATLSGEE